MYVVLNKKKNKRTKVIAIDNKIFQNKLSLQPKTNLTTKTTAVNLAYVIYTLIG